MMSTWLWIIVIAVGIVVLLVVIGLIGYWAESSALKQLQRSVKEKNVEALIQALTHWNDKVRIQAAAALVELQGPAAAPALVDIFLAPSTKPAVRSGIATAILKLPVDQVVPLLVANTGAEQQNLAIDLLRRFETPEARAAIQKLRQERTDAEAASAKQREIVTLRLSQSPEQPYNIVTLSLPSEFGKGAVAGKVIGGMLTGGVMAVSANRFTLDGFVILPKMCPLCGRLPGKYQRTALGNFRIGSAAWALTGVNAAAEASLNYKICAWCNDIDKEHASIKLDVARDEQKAWHARLSILNPEIAKEIEKLNAEVIAVRSAGANMTLQDEPTTHTELPVVNQVRGGQM